MTANTPATHGPQAGQPEPAASGRRPEVTLAAPELERLVRLIRQRVGRRADAPELAHAYLQAVVRSAFDRTTGSGPVPTSLAHERAAVLIEVCRALGRVVEDYEVQALYRVTPSQARSIRTTLLSTYADDAESLILTWSLRGGHTHQRRQGSTFSGTLVSFTSAERRDAFIGYAERLGVAVEAVHGEDGLPYLALVGDHFPADRLPPRVDDP